MSEVLIIQGLNGPVLQATESRESKSRGRFDRHNFSVSKAEVVLVKHKKRTVQRE